MALPMEVTQAKAAVLGGGSAVSGDAAGEISLEQPLYTEEYLWRQGEEWKEGGEAGLPPPDFICPLSLEVLVDPVVIASGHTYERAYIDKWFQFGHTTCPKTNQILAHAEVRPNDAARKVIGRWCKAHGIQLPTSVSVGPEVDMAERAATANQNGARQGWHTPGESPAGTAGRVQFRGARIQFYRQQFSRRKLLHPRAAQQALALFPDPGFAETLRLEIQRASAAGHASPPPLSLPPKQGSPQDLRALLSLTAVSNGVRDSPGSGSSSSSSSPRLTLPLGPSPPAITQTGRRSAGGVPSPPAPTELPEGHAAKVLPLLELARGGDWEQAYAVEGLRRVSKGSAAARRQLAELGAIPLLLQVIAGGPLTALEQGLTTLLNLTLEESLKRTIVTAGAIDVLVCHVSSPHNATCQATAIGALCNLAVLDANRSDICQSGIVPKLIQIIGIADLRRIQHDAILLLFNLAISEPCKAAIANAGCAEVLLYHLDTDGLDKDTLIDLLLLLSSLARLPQVQHLIQKFDGVRILASLLASPSLSLQAHAAALLLLVASSPGGQQSVGAEVETAALETVALCGSKRGRAKAQALLKLLRSK